MRDRLAALKEWFTPKQLYFWRIVTLITLVTLLTGAFFASREVNFASFDINPNYIVIACAIYAVTYIIQSLAWHNLLTIVYGKLPLRINTEAIASSELVKYLPTVLWHIAKRTHFYASHDIPAKAIVSASTIEQILMVVFSAALYLLVVGVASSYNLALLLSGVSIGLLLIFIFRSKLKTLWKAAIENNVLRNQTISLRVYYLQLVTLYVVLWLLGGLFLWAIINIFTVLDIANYVDVLQIWLLASLAGYAITLTLGVLGVAREATLAALLLQIVPTNISVASAISVKLLLTLLPVICAGLVLSWMYLIRRLNV